MSLDTVIKIGKQYRQTKDSWKYHEQVALAIKDVEMLSKKKDKDGANINTHFYEINVEDNGETYHFDIDNIKEIVDEDKCKSIYYLNFKANKKDTFKKYLFGDIIYSGYINKNGQINENGNYRLHGQWEGNKKSSFWKCEDIVKNIDNPIIIKFRNEFKNQISNIEKILSDNQSVVIHFNFNGKRWADLDGIIDSIDNFICQDLVSKYAKTNKVVLEKYIYKTLGGCTPGFSDDAKYKNRLFETDEIISLLYAKTATEKPIIRIGNIGILALPHSDSIKSEQIVDFFERKKDNSTDDKINEESEKESDINTNIDNESDSLFADLIENDFVNKVKFDIVFTNIPKSASGVYTDMIEITDIEKSLLERVNTNIINKRQEVMAAARKAMPNNSHLFNFQIRISYLKIFGDATRDKKKYYSHLLRIIPQIYTDTFYEDPLLLPTFINKVEYNIRNNGQGFNTLKYDLYFLFNIQKKNCLMNIMESKSYALGKALGAMATPFAAWRTNCPIKSFEKMYVGNLSRRSGSIKELVQFADYINEKLVIHEKAYETERKAYEQFINTIKTFGTEKYDKYNFSLGFFEVYFGNN